jgi:cation diffusion facilitator family transporter
LNRWRQYESHPALTGMRSTLLGIMLNMVLAVTKGVAGFLGHSFALMADALESLSDIVNSLIVYFGLRLSIKPPDANHPYGHGKFEPIAATIVGMSLTGAALTIAVVSVREILTPHQSPAPYTLIVLAGVVIIKEWLFHYVNEVGQAIESTAVRADAWHHRSDAITSSLAFVGISIGLIGGKGYETADDWAALGASCIILYNAYRQLRPALAELTDAAPPGDIDSAVRRVASAVPGVAALEKCFVRKMGFDLYVDLHVVVDGDLPVREGHRIAHRVKDAILASDSRIAEVLVHVEPLE